MTTLALSWRECRYWLTRYAVVWPTTVISAVMNPVLYLAAVGIGIGTIVNRHAGASALGGSYLAFVAPALVAAAAMQTAVGEATIGVLGSVKWKRNYFAAAATPLSVTSVVIGHLTYIAMRIVLTSVVYIAILAMFGAAHSITALATVPAALLTGLAFAAPVSAWSVTLRTGSGFAALQRFIVLPMFLFSGTFFPVARLPVALRAVAYATPLWHGADLCRMLARGTVDAPLAGAHVAYLSGLIVAGLAAARITYVRRLSS